MSLLLAFTTAESAATTVALDLFKLLAAASLVSLVLRRIGLPVIPCYLITGALIGPGPFTLGLIASDASVSAISSLAMVLLMFTVGLHLDPSAIRGGMIRTLLVGVMSTLLVVTVLTPLAMLAGLNATTAAAVAMAVSMSSTAVVLQLLAQRRETHRMHGRMCVGVSITQDLLSLVFLALMPVLARLAHVTGSGDAGAHGALLLPADWSPVAKAAAGVAGIIVLIAAARLLLPPLLTEASRGAGSELLLVVAAAAALCAAIAAAGLGFSAELGAFLAGFVLAGTTFRHQLTGQLAPMVSLLMAVFFTAVGLKLRIDVLLEGWWIVLAGLACVMVFKSFLIAASAWALGATAPVAVLTGLTMSQAGEFTIVLLGAGEALGVIDPHTTAINVAIVVVSLVLTPTLYRMGRRLEPLASRIPVAGWSEAGALRQRHPEPEPALHTPHAPAPGPGASPLSPTPEGAPVAGAAQPLGQADAAGSLDASAAPRGVIIAGFGVVGRALADRLEVAGIRFCIVDLNRATVQTQRRLGRVSIYGDISNPEVLESAGVVSADAVFLTIPDDEATLRACRAIRAVRPDIFIAARTTFLAKAFAAQALGADHVVVEEVATAELMAREVIQRLQERAARGRGA